MAQSKGWFLPTIIIECFIFVHQKEEIDQFQVEKRFYLSENAKELEKMQLKHEKCSKDYEEKLAQMSSEMQLMTNTISKLSLIIERIESGSEPQP